MPNIFHQTIEDILRAATPEQKLIWNYLFLRFGERISISQFVYTGLIAGSELTNYSATKIYLGYEIIWNGFNTAQTSMPQSVLYDNNNVIFLEISEGAAAWDATAAVMRYSAPSIKFKNLWFSRITGTSRIHFIGYRIGI